MDSYDAQQVEAQFVADSKKKAGMEAERDAEEKIVQDSHNGGNIAQIAGKAAKAELVQTKKDLAAAHKQICDLQEKFNLFTGVVPSQPIQAAAQPRSVAAMPTTGTNKRKVAELASKSKLRAEDAMSDEPSVASSSKQSNFRGGGRTQKKQKKDTEGNAGGVVRPNKQEQRPRPRTTDS